MPRILPAIALLICLLALACSGDDDDDGVSSGAGSISSPTPTEATSGDDKPTPAPTPEPGAVSVANEPFSVETPDGVVLRGHAYTPDGPRRQALVIVAPVEQSTWAESTQAFTREGIAVFTFDLRGYGETGGEADAKTTAADAQLVSRFVMSREYPLVYLFGAGADGGAAVTEAAANLEELSGLATYGFESEGDGNHLTLTAGAEWNGENVLADSTVTEQLLTFVLGGN